MKKTTGDEEWPSLRRFQERMRRQGAADEALKYAGTPEKPYVQKLSSREQAFKDDMEQRAAEAAEERKRLLERARDLGIDPEDDSDKIHIGPRGGRYRINNNNHKSYDVP